MKTILVPIDFSDNSKNALYFAIKLSQKLQAQLILFHSFHTFHSSAYISAQTMDQGSLTAKRLAEQELEETYNGLAVSAFSQPEYVCSKNEMREEILNLVSDKQVDLIVMGTQGASNRLEGQLFGTNTSWVVEHAPCPVIAIPGEIKLETLTEIVYASAYLPSDIPNLAILSQIAQAFGATVTIIHIAKEESDETLKALESFENRVKAVTGMADVYFKLLKGSNVEKRLEQYLDETYIDLLVMSAQRRDLADKLFGKSITKMMTLYSRISLMIFHHEEE